MSEVYRNTSQVVNLDIYGADADETPTATLIRGEDETDLTVTSETPPEGIQDRYQTRIELSETQKEDEFKIVWDFAIMDEPAQKIDYFEVVQPYVTVVRAREELGLTEATDEEIMRAERKVRRVINRYCGQSFGLRRETILVKGSGTYNIQLPQRASHVYSITRHDLGIPLEEGMYEIRREGLVLRRYYGGDTSGTAVITVNPIYNPFYDVKSDTFMGSGPVFHANVEWDIDADWGYDRLPGPVEDAALILLEQYLCNENTYRERYVNSMASADYRYTHTSGAFRATGNAVVDYILQDYVWDNIWLI